jgi:putative endonuclease
MYKVYILKSKNYNRYYIGHTLDLDFRLRRHNNGNVRSIKSYCPWEVVHTEDFKNKSLACLRELKIKSYKGGNAFKKLID